MLVPVAGEFMWHRQIIVNRLLDTALAVFVEVRLCAIKTNNRNKQNRGSRPLQNLIQTYNGNNVTGKIKSYWMTFQRFRFQPAITAIATKDRIIRDFGAKQNQIQGADRREDHVQHKVPMIVEANAIVQPGYLEKNVRTGLKTKDQDQIINRFTHDNDDPFSVCNAGTPNNDAFAAASVQCISCKCWSFRQSAMVPRAVRPASSIRPCSSEM